MFGFLAHTLIKISVWPRQNTPAALTLTSVRGGVTCRCSLAIFPPGPGAGSGSLTPKAQALSRRLAEARGRRRRHLWQISAQTSLTSLVRGQAQISRLSYPRLPYPRRLRRRLLHPLRPRGELGPLRCACGGVGLLSVCLSPSCPSEHVGACACRDIECIRAYPESWSPPKCEGCIVFSLPRRRL